VFCPNCGEEVEEDVKFCRHCGYDLAKEKEETEELMENVRDIDEGGSTRIIEEFIELVKSTTKWSGRFDRRQYVIVFVGMFLICPVIIGVSLGIIGVSLGIASVVIEPWGFMDLLLTMFALAWCVVATIVYFGAGMRRFHDLDLSGWYCLLLLIPLIWFFTFLYLLFKSGKEVGETRWG